MSLVVLGARLRADRTSVGGTKSFSAGWPTAGLACWAIAVALAATRLGVGLSNGFSRIDGVAFVGVTPAGGLADGAVVVAGLWYLGSSTRARLAFGTAVVGTLVATASLPASDRPGAWGMAAFGVVAVIARPSTRRLTRVATLGASGSLALVALAAALLHDGNGGAGSMIPGQGSWDVVARLLPLAPLALLFLVPMALLDVRTAVAAAVLCAPLAGTHAGLLLLATRRLPYRGAHASMSDGIRAFDHTYEVALAADLVVAVVAVAAVVLASRLHRHRSHAL